MLPFAIICLGWWWALCLVVHAEFPTPELQFLVPPCVTLGTEAVLKPGGSHLDGPQALLFSRQGLAAQVVTGPPQLLAETGRPTGEFRVTTTRTNSIGLVDLRFQGRFGVSNPRKLLLTHKTTEQLTQEPGTGLAAELEMDRIYWGQFAPARRLVFRFELGPGQALAAVAHSQAIDARATPRLAVLDAEGRELARSRAIGEWPARLEVASESGGVYQLVMHDFLYRGGPEYAFMLEAAKSDQADSIQLELDRLTPPTLQQDAQAGSPALDVLTAPFRTDGRFRGPQQSVTFRASQGSQWWIEVQSAQHQRLTDPRVILSQLERADDGSETIQRLNEQDDQAYLGGPEVRLKRLDPAFAWTAPTDGHYRLELLDQQSGARPPGSREYSLSVAQPEPSCLVHAFPATANANRSAARPQGCNLLRGGSLAIQLLVERQQGFSGAVRVRPQSLPEGVVAQEAWIPASAQEGTLLLQASPEAAAWCGALELVATASPNPLTKAPQIQPVTVRFPPSPTRNAFDWRTCGRLMLCVNADDLCPLSIHLARDQQGALEAQQGSELSIPLHIDRRNENKSACVLRPRDLPPKTQLAELTIPADKQEGVAKLVIPADTPVGEYTLWLQAEAQVPWPHNPQALTHAEAYLTRLEQAQKDPQATGTNPDALASAIAEQRKLVEQLKQQTAPRDTKVWLPSTGLTLKILPKTS